MDSINKRLAVLYPDTATELSQQLSTVIEDFKKSHPAPVSTSKTYYSEKDVMLITYADHVQEDGVKTLQTLKKFLDKHVKGYMNKVHFLPFFPYTSDDGFSVVDYYKIKDEFGDWKDVAAISVDFGLMFDFVVNHISQKSEWFQKFLAGDEKFMDYFISFDEPIDTSSVFRPRTHPLLTPFETAKGKKYVWTTFSEDQIDVNIKNPEVLLAMLKILLFFVDQGATAIRLDAIGYLWKELGTSSIHLQQTHEVVKIMRGVLEEVAPYVWIITETNVPHKDNISYFGTGNDEAHMVYNFTLPPLLLMSFLSGNAERLSDWLATLEYPTDKTSFFNFTASHDGVGLQPLKGIVPQEEVQKLADYVLANGGKVNYRAVPGKDPEPYELNVVYMSALGGSVEAMLASQAIQISLRGVPGIYLNSFVGEENWTEGVEKLGYNRAINRRKFDFATLTKALQDTSTKHGQVYQGYTKMLKARINEPLFSPHVEQKVLRVDPKVFALLRYTNDANLLVLVNVSKEEVTVDLSKVKTELGKDTMKDLLSGNEVKVNSPFIFKPYDVLWLK